MNSLAAQENEALNDDWADLADDDDTKERKADLERYRNSLDSAKDSPVYEYLTSDKGYTEDEIKRMQLGYYETTKSLVVPIRQGRSSADLTGFLYRPIERFGTLVRAKPYEESHLTSSILIGDPDYVDEHALIIVSDPLDLYRLRIGTDLTTDNVSPEISVAILGSQISEAHARRLKELNPRSIVFIRGEETRAKELEESIRKFCLNEVIRLSVVALGATDVSEYIKTHGEEALKKKIEEAKSSVLDQRERGGKALLTRLGTKRRGLKTGWAKFDKKLRIPVGAVTIIAGRPKHGKTTFLYNLMLQMIESGLHTDKRFYFFSFEEDADRIEQKIVSRALQAAEKDVKTIAAKQHFSDVRNGEDLLHAYALKRQVDPLCSVEELDSALATLDKLASQYDIIDERLTVERLDSTIRNLAKRHKDTIGAIFIDYMQRIPTETKQSSIREAIVHVSETLKWCAKETGLPMIIGSQINRDAKNYDRPTQENLKESGNLEEDANLVLCVFNITQNEIDKGAKNAHSKRKGESYHDIQVYTLSSRDSEPSETEFVMTNRYFKEG